MIKQASPKKVIVAVVGPTGSGKTALAVKLAQEFDGVIISADSRQVYRGLDAGTNKEGEVGEWCQQKARIIDGIPQLLTDIVPIGQRYNVAEWVKLAEQALELCFREGRLPLIVGGTGLYISALLSGYQFGGRNFKGQTGSKWPYLILGLEKPLFQLYQKSDVRLEKSLMATVAEVRTLVSKGVDPEWLWKFGLDYRSAVNVLRGADFQIELTALSKSSRAYIRRQLTWWRHHEPVLKIQSAAQAITLVADYLKTDPN